MPTDEEASQLREATRQALAQGSPDRGVLDAAWAGSHVRVHFGEATWAGGDPCAWEPGEDGVRWYRDRLL